MSENIVVELKVALVGPQRGSASRASDIQVMIAQQDRVAAASERLVQSLLAFDQALTWAHPVPPETAEIGP